MTIVIVNVIQIPQINPAWASERCSSKMIVLFIVEPVKLNAK